MSFPEMSLIAIPIKDTQKKYIFSMIFHKQGYLDITRRTRNHDGLLYISVNLMHISCLIMLQGSFLVVNLQ